jgi:hypothetical protein
VYGGDSETETANLLTQDGLLLDVVRVGNSVRIDRISFSQSRFRYYRVVIENEAEPPLTIVGARVLDREETRAPRTYHEAAIAGVNENRDERTTIVVVDLKSANLPIVGLELQVLADGDFFRTVTLETSDTVENTRSFRPVATFDIYRIRPAGREPRQSLTSAFPEARGRYLRITIQNGDDQPVTVQQVTAESIDTWLVCERERLVGAAFPTALYAGDKQLAAPQYDLSRTAGEVSVTALDGSASIGPRQSNPLFVGPNTPRRPWSEEHWDLIWTLTIGGVALFGGLTALLLWKAAKSPLSESEAA